MTEFSMSGADCASEERKGEKPVSVAFILNRLGENGPGIDTLNIIRSMHLRGYDVTLVTVMDNKSKPAKHNFEMNLSRKISQLIVPVVAKFLLFFRKNKFDYTIVSVGWLSVWIVIAHKLTHNKNSKCLLLLRSNIQHIMKSKTIRRKLSWFVTRYLAKRIDGIANVSGGASKGTEYYLNVNKVHTLYSPVVWENDVWEEHPQPQHSFFEEDYKKIVSCGRLVPVKNHEFMLHAFSLALLEDNTLRLIILGEGKLRTYLESLSEQLGISDCVSMPGFIPEPMAYMAHADLFWFTSLYEGFGNVLVEAMATGTNIVSSDCPYGPKEILDNGKFGYLVNNRDPQAHAETLLQALEKPKCTPNQLKQRALDFSVEAATDNYIHVLHSL